MSLKLNQIKNNQLRRYRERRSLRQRDITDLLGLQQTTDIYRWETGQRIPTLMNALKLSAALDCPIEILFLDHFNSIRKQMRQKKLKLINK